MATKEEPIPTFPLKWGQLGLMLLATAVAAVYAPVWLLYAGLIRFAWCLVGGHAGRGLASFAAFGLVYLAVTFGVPDVYGARDSAAAITAPTSAITASPSVAGNPAARPAAPSSAVLTAASFRHPQR